MAYQTLYRKYRPKTFELVFGQDTIVKTLKNVIKNNKIIAKAHNMVEKKKNSIMHAEIIAITKASKKIRNWRLNNCDMYVSWEPCDMCKAAILLSRINKVYYLVKKDKNININKNKFIYLSDYEKKSLNLIQDFFKNRR